MVLFLVLPPKSLAHKSFLLKPFSGGNKHKPEIGKYQSCIYCRSGITSPEYQITSIKNETYRHWVLKGKYHGEKEITASFWIEGGFTRNVKRDLHLDIRWASGETAPKTHPCCTPLWNCSSGFYRDDFECPESSFKQDWHHLVVEFKSELVLQF